MKRFHFLYLSMRDMNTRTSGIYKIINKTTLRYYVGSSLNIEGSRGRWKEHVYRLRRGNHQNSQLQYAWNKYGKEDFDWSIVVEVPKENLLLEEQKYLDIAKAEKEKCYNTQFIAGRVEMTPEVRKKLSVACKGRKLTKEHKQKISDALKGTCSRPAGWHHTEESKLKISKNGFRWTGKKLSSQHIQRLVDSHIGIRPSKETTEKMSKSRMGRVVSEETRRLISLKAKGRTLSQKTKLKISLNRRGKGVGENNASKRPDVRKKISLALMGNKNGVKI